MVFMQTLQEKKNPQNTESFRLTPHIICEKKKKKNVVSRQKGRKRTKLRTTRGNNKWNKTDCPKNNILEHSQTPFPDPAFVGGMQPKRREKHGSWKRSRDNKASPQAYHKSKKRVMLWKKIFERFPWNTQISGSKKRHHLKNCGITSQATCSKPFCVLEVCSSQWILRNATWPEKQNKV